MGNGPVVSQAVDRAMELLGKFRFVPANILARECFPDAVESSRAPMTSRMLKKLREAGLVDRQMVLGRTWVHWLTEEGARAQDIEGGRGVGVKLAEYEHDLAILRLWLILKDDPRVETIVTERQARSECPDPSQNPWAVPITRQSGKKGYAWPDLITTGSNGQWGHEVEWTTKNKQRLRLLMLAYGYHPDYSGGMYYGTPTSQHVIEECAAAVNNSLADGGYGRQIITRDLSEALGEDL